MPNTITYTNLANVLPEERLLMYQKVFGTQNAIELHGAYIWSVKVAACMHPLLSALEVALRNSIHISASKIIGANWYDVLKTNVRKSWSSKNRDINNITWHNNEIARVKNKIKNKTPPKGLTIHDLLVAKMDFGFWDNLLRQCFSCNGDKSALWPQCMPDVFPNIPKGYTNSSVQKEVSLLRDMRNDIAHNSPIWKNRAVTDTNSAVRYINSMIDKILEIISWLSTEKVNWLEVHMLKAEAQRIASKEYLLLCQRKDIRDITRPYTLYKRELRRKLKKLRKDEFDIIELNGSKLYMVTKINA